MKFIRGILAAAVAAGSVSASAQTYPIRNVGIVVPYPAGGSVDGVARIMEQKLHERLGQSFIVENRAGRAGGIVGANYVAKAAPDGYALMLTASIHVITPFLSKKMPYDVVKDFMPISLIATGPLIVSTTPSVAAGTSRISLPRCARSRQSTPSGRRASARPAIWRSSSSSARPVSIRW